MKKIRYFLFIFFLLFFSENTRKTSRISQISSIESYEKFLEKHSFSLVLFSHSSCSLSKSLEKPLKKAGKELKVRFQRTKDPFFANLGFAQVKLQRNSSLKNLLKITETPTLMIYRGKIPYKTHKGGLFTNFPLLEWFINEILKEIPFIKTKEELKVFMRNNRNYVIFESFNEENEDFRYGDFMRNLRLLKEKYKGIQFRIYQDFPGFIKKDFCWEKMGILKVFSKGIYEEIDLKKLGISKENPDFLGKIVPVFDSILQRNRGNLALFFEENEIRRVLSNKTAAFVIWGWPRTFFADFMRKNEEILKEFISKNSKIQVFLAIYEKDSEMKKWLKFVGLNDENPFEIALMILNQKNNEENIEKFVYKGKFPLKLEFLEEFYAKFEKGKLRPFLRNSIVKKKKINDNFFVINAKSYEKLLFEEKTKDILIGFCAKKEKKCMVFYNFFEEFAGELFHLESLIFAIFDPETDDFRGKEVRYYPTIRLFKANARENPLEFNGNTIEKSGLDEFLRNSLSILNITKIRKTK